MAGHEEDEIMTLFGIAYSEISINTSTLLLLPAVALLSIGRHIF